MKIRCFLFGCAWEPGVECKLGDELIKWQRCTRCAAHRYVSTQ